MKKVWHKKQDNVERQNVNEEMTKMLNNNIT